MEQQSGRVSRTLKGLGTGVSRLPSFLFGLLIIAVLAGGAYGAWRVYSKCGGKGVSSCLLSSVNPIPASYGRGVGKPLGCGPNEEHDGALCYPKCQAGYKGVGPVCWEECSSGFKDEGALCAKPAPYPRGTGFPWKFGDGPNDHKMYERCEKEHGDGNCQKDGDLVYPKCKADFHNFGCCVCTPDCPPGMTDGGVSCNKKSEGRSAGVPIHACPEGAEKEGALCYPQCKSGFKGVGPVCWEQKT